MRIHRFTGTKKLHPAAFSICNTHLGVADYVAHGENEKMYVEYKDCTLVVEPSLPETNVSLFVHAHISKKENKGVREKVKQTLLALKHFVDAEC